MGSKNKKSSNKIAVNKRTRFEYRIEERLEAGVELLGWEVKSLRAGRLQFGDSYILLKDQEAFLFGCRIDPLPTASTHTKPDPVRTRRLLLHRREINRVTALVERKNFTAVPTALYWSRGKVKVEIGIAKGKRQHDKRADQKARDWQRQKARILKHG